MEKREQQSDDSAGLALPSLGCQLPPAPACPRALVGTTRRVRRPGRAMRGRRAPGQRLPGSTDGLGGCWLGGTPGLRGPQRRWVLESHLCPIPEPPPAPGVCGVPSAGRHLAAPSPPCRMGRWSILLLAAPAPHPGKAAQARGLPRCGGAAGPQGWGCPVLPGLAGTPGHRGASACAPRLCR